MIMPKSRSKIVFDDIEMYIAYFSD